jgi:hypothetical protein
LLQELTRKLPDEAFHLQIKKRSENIERVQAGVFHDIVNRSRLGRTQESENPLTVAGEPGGDQQVALLRVRLLGFGRGGLDRCGPQFDHVLRVGDEFAALRDRLVRREADGLGHIPCHTKDFAAEPYGPDWR